MQQGSLGRPGARGPGRGALLLPLVLPLAPQALAGAAPAAPQAAAALAADRLPWATALGGPGADAALAVAEAAGGGFLVAGSTTPQGAGAHDVLVARLERDGRVAWELAVGGAGNEDASALVATADGGCLVAGTTDSFGAGGIDGWLVRLAADGSVLWQRTYGSAGDEGFVALDAAPDGFFVGGTVQTATSGADAWVLAVDAAGNVLWQETLAGEAEDHLAALAATPDGLAVAIASNSALGGKGGVPFSRPWLVALDPMGGSLWQRTYDVSGGDVWLHVQPLADGGFVATGEVLAASFFRGDVWLVRLDADGEVVFDRRFGDHFGVPGFDAGRQVRATRDGGFTVLGATQTGGAGGQDPWLIHVDAAGALQWQRTYGGGGFDDGFGLTLAREGGLVVAGNVQRGALAATDAVVLRLDEEGGTAPSCDLGGPTSPNVWTTPAVVERVDVAPTTAAFASAPSTARATPLATAQRLCPRR